MDITKLFGDHRFRLEEAVRSGKKPIAGILRFKGIGPKADIIRAVEGGRVIFAGRVYDSKKRDYRRGIFVEVEGRDGVIVSYQKMRCINVETGDMLCEGDTIGVVDDNQVIEIEFRKNGRHVDGCAYLDIPRKKAEYRRGSHQYELEAAQRFGLTSEMRNHINSYKYADAIWEKLANSR